MGKDDAVNKEKVESEDSLQSQQKSYQSTGIDAKKHPDDVQENIMATVNATANDVPDIPSGENNAPVSVDKHSEKDLEVATTCIEPLPLPEPVEVVRDVDIPGNIVCPVVQNANASVPETDITSIKKCACGSTTHLR